MELSPGADFHSFNNDTILLTGIATNDHNLDSPPRQFTRKQSQLQLRPTRNPRCASLQNKMRIAGQKEKFHRLPLPSMTNAKFRPLWNISRSPSGMELQRSAKAITSISKKSMQHALGGRLWLSEPDWRDCKNRAPIPCEKNAAP
jgi:hypothetical protein